jgi:hypothetical protein
LTRARQIFSDLNAEVPFYQRSHFIESLAALVKLYPDEVVRMVPGHNKPVYKMLWNATAVDRMEWLFNNIRVRHAIPIAQVQLLGAGSAPNEALHAEINNWFRQTQLIHQSTLRLKLDIMCYYKLVAHSSAMYRPTSRQMPSKHVLVRSLGAPIWTQTTWKSWCRSLMVNGKISKTILPIRQLRVEEAKKVKQYVKKRPAAYVSLKRPSSALTVRKTIRKRTVFTRERNGLLLRQGSKST